MDRLPRIKTELLGTGPLADAFIRLDFVWHRTFTGALNRVKIRYEQEMGDLLYNVSITTVNAETRVGIVTTMNEVVESEIDHFRDQLALVMGSVLDVFGDVVDNPDETYISAVVAGKAAGGPRPIQESDIVVHVPIFRSDRYGELTEDGLTDAIRDETNVRVDVRKAGSGFNIYIRKEVIKRDTAEQMVQVMLARGNFERHDVKILYIPGKSDALPEPA